MDRKLLDILACPATRMPLAMLEAQGLEALNRAIATGGVLRDTVAGIAATGALGTAMQSTDASYGVVYHVEIGLLFLTLAALGPLVAAKRAQRTTTPGKFGMAELPG